MSLIYNISTEFTDTPGPRLIAEGKFSGELFLKDILLPKFNEAKSNNYKLIIDLDGTFGYPPSFLDEAFGGLVKATSLNKKEILKYLEIKSSREYYIDTIYNRMEAWEEEHGI